MDNSEISQLRLPDKMRMVDRVFRSLEEGILTGRMPPGTRLVEQAVGQRLGVSRTTVREALLMLERQGLVESTPRGGTFVTRLSSEAAWDLCKARALLEGYAVQTGYASFNANMFAELRRLTMEMSVCVLPNGVPRLVELDIAFHLLIVQRAKSAHLLELWSGLNGQIRALYLATMEVYQFGIPEIVALHERLIADLASDDINRAQCGTLHHYMGQRDTGHEETNMQRLLALIAD